MLVCDPARVHGGAAGADDTADHAGELLDQGEPSREPTPTPPDTTMRAPFRSTRFASCTRRTRRTAKSASTRPREPPPTAGCASRSCARRSTRTSTISPVAALVRLGHHHDTLAHGRHLGPVLGTDDGGDDVAAEGGTHLVQQVLVLRALHDVVADEQVRAVGRQACAQGTRHTRRQVAAGGRRPVQHDLRLARADELADDAGVGQREVVGERRRAPAT